MRSIRPSWFSSNLLITFSKRSWKPTTMQDVFGTIINGKCMRIICLLPYNNRQSWQDWTFLVLNINVINPLKTNGYYIYHLR